MIAIKFKGITSLDKLILNLITTISPLKLPPTHDSGNTQQCVKSHRPKIPHITNGNAQEFIEIQTLKHKNLLHVSKIYLCMLRDENWVSQPIVQCAHRPVVDTYKMLIATTKHNGYNKTYKEETMLKIGLSQYCYNFLLVLIIKIQYIS